MTIIYENCRYFRRLSLSLCKLFIFSTYSVPVELKLKFWNALKPDYHVPAVSVSWLVSQYRLQITTIFDLDWEAILEIMPV